MNRLTITAAVILLLLQSSFVFPQIKSTNTQSDVFFVKHQNTLDYNNIQSWIQNSGTFNQDIRTNNTPGFMWPKGSNRFAVFTTGLSIGAYVNGNLRLATASYNGEYQPGAIDLINGSLNLFSDSTFKIYIVYENDNCATNMDWANWGAMVPYGAPYTDANGNLQYDPCIDTPGVHGAGQTVFMCLTDGYLENHSQSEGFSGGTNPLNAEVRLTAWAFSDKCVNLLRDAQFFRWQIINKNNAKWDSTRFSIVADVDLGSATDDYIGCDTIREMVYSYNSDDDDGNGYPPSYGRNPPAVGIRMLRNMKNKNSPTAVLGGCSSICYFSSTGAGGPTCEQDPQQPIEAYNFMNGKKKDGSNWINPLTLLPTKFTYPGNPLTGKGWSEFSGKINNCGSDSGFFSSSPPGDRRFLISSGHDNFLLNPLDTMDIIMTQLIARDYNNLIAVGKLLSYSDLVKNLFNFYYKDHNPVVSINPVHDPNSILPTGFYLSNNFPNPFNPTTKINYGLPYDFKLEIAVYDILGNEVAKLFDGIQVGGNYTLEFDGSNLSSGIYFLKFKSGSFIITRKMMLLK
jgi:hypothetical protein